MKKYKSYEIRKLWIDFFKSKNHILLESSPLIPKDDPSLFFVNAGVTPLKKYFDGSVVPDNKRIVSIQKCIRTNDIENVGVTKRHLTYFEMMGNFSIGDYFKKEALEFTYEFLTSEKWCNIPKEKIYVTVYTDDDEAYNKWIELGLTKKQVIRLDGNFWEIGQGPCGPDSEIFFDRGSKYDPLGDAYLKFINDEDQERYIEIWNNVFSQYNSEENKERKDYKELPHKNIDTGAGFERWCCIFQDVDSPFDTDLFIPILEQIENISKVKYTGQTSFKVIADHIRTITMAISDGAIFENSNRGYVLRRLLRRSVRMGRKLNINEPFMYKLVDVVADTMKESYPEVEENKGKIKVIILEEEKLFNDTLKAGEKKLLDLIKNSHDKKISGYDIFKLYDTYGFPFELTLEYLEEEGIKVDENEFLRYMEEAKRLAKDNHKNENNMNIQNESLLNFKEDSQFTYDDYELDNVKVIGIFDNEKELDELNKEGYIILDKTCFYAESGGQVSDIGAIKGKNFKGKITSVKKSPNGQHLHYVELIEGSIKKGDLVSIAIRSDLRNMTRVNHSLIHVIQHILKKELSDNITQAGSYVDYERLRFDFNYSGKIKDEDIINIEEKVLDYVKNNYKVNKEYMSLDVAKKKGAIALFEDKYQNIVRVVTIGDSIELCGGTHMDNTNEVEKFAILKVESKGSNVYRLEACSNDYVYKLVRDSVKSYLDEVKTQFERANNIIEKAKKDEISLEFNPFFEEHSLSSYKDIVYNKNQVEYIQNEVRELEKKYDDIKRSLLSKSLDKYLDNKKVINGVESVIMRLDNYDIKDLKTIVDSVTNMLNEGFVFFINIKDGSASFICKSASKYLPAGLIVKKVSEYVGGRGGGSSSFAQGGVANITEKQVNEVLDIVLKGVEEIK